MKKIFCLILSLLMAMQCTAFFAYAVQGKTPVLSYSFEDSSNAPSLFGNAKLVYNHDKMSNVLSLDGSENTYAEIPQGFFDGRDVMTIQFDILPNNQWGNFFTFCFGADNIKYSFFRIRNDDNSDTKTIRNCITTNSWQNERDVNYTRANYNGWMHIALVYDNNVLKLYVDGTKVSENTNTGLKVSDLGSNLYSYLGRSLYNGDGWFNGCFDNFEVYDCVLSDSEIAETAEANLPEAMASLRYTFEDGTTLPTLRGNAATVYDSEHKSKVLSLDGTSNTYAEITRGFFDNKDEMTVLFDIKPGSNSGNFFTFAFGQNSTYYDFFRIRGSEIRNAMTLNTYYSEREVKTSSESTDSWMTIALVFENGKCQLYVNGTLKATNNDAHKVSDLGSNLYAYFGKSFYDGDGYFNGLFDNFEVYDKVLSPETIENKAKAHLPLLLSVNVGEVVSNLDGVSGTDSHTMVSTSINRENGEISSIIQRRQDPSAVPVNFISLNDGCVIYVDNEVFTNNSNLDLTYDRSIRIVHGETSEEYTLKAAEIANNPVLPGMYADPDIDVFDGKFWIYPTTDGVAGWGGTQFHAFSSEDMETWTDEGVILDNKDKNPGLNDKGVQIASCSWSNGNAWAPSIEKKNGKYYFYFCGRILSEYESTYGEGMAIGVAYADSPAGPYTASSSPILYPKMVSDANIGYEGQVIDPAVYTEGNTSYLLFGNGNAAIAELNSDMLTVKTSTLRKLEGLDGFRESVAVFKRNGIYYWHWSCDDTGSENYHIRYGTSTSLTGSITYRGILVEKDPENGILATGHQSIIYIPETDKCFIAYHRFYTPLSIGGNVGHHRETCVDEVTFNRNVGGIDLLNEVTPSMAGVGKVDINGISVNNCDATSLSNKKLEWDFGLTPAIAYPMPATYGDSNMTLVYWGDNTYYYDGSNGLRTNDGYTYIENIASKLEDGKDIDITIKMITNERYNNREAGAFAIGSEKGTGDGECEFNDLLYLKNDGTMSYRGAGSTENIRAGATNGVSQGEHTYRIYFRNSTKTISVYQDSKLIGFKQDNSLSKSRFNFLALGVWRNTYFGNNTIEKVTISQPDIKDAGYINKDNLINGISKQSVSQEIGYGSLEAVIDEINSTAFQTSYAEIRNNENLYTPSSLRNYYASLNRVKIFDASSTVYDYSGGTTVSGAADEVASIVSNFNSYKTPDLRADFSNLQKAYDKANALLKSLNGKAAQYDADSINTLISAATDANVSAYLNADEQTRAEYGQAVQANADALEEAIITAINSLKLSVSDSEIDTSAYEAAVAIVNSPDPDAYNVTTSITSARSTANTLVGTSTISYGTSTINVFDTQTTKGKVDDATSAILTALSNSVKTYSVTTQGVSETSFKNGTADGTSSPYTATYGTTAVFKSDDGETAWYMEITSGTSHRKEQFQGYGRGLEIRVVGDMVIKAVKPSATTSQVKIVREYSDVSENKYPVQLVDYVTTGSYFTLPAAPALAYYTFGGYYINNAEYKDEEVKIDSDTEIVAKYVLNSDASCAINATDINNDVVFNSSVNYNTKVSLEGSDGAYGWVEEIGDNKFRPFYIGENVDFFASESTNLKAVGESDFNFSTPCINLRKSGVIKSETKTIFNAQLFDAGREIKEYGILIGTGDITADALIVENSGTHETYRVIRAKSTRLVGANQFAISVNNLSDDFSYRGYVIYENSDKEFVTAYTEVIA